MRFCVQNHIGGCKPPLRTFNHVSTEHVGADALIGPRVRCRTLFRGDVGIAPYEMTRIRFENQNGWDGNLYVSLDRIAAPTAFIDTQAQKTTSLTAWALPLGEQILRCRWQMKQNLRSVSAS